MAAADAPLPLIAVFAPDTQAPPISDRATLFRVESSMEKREAQVDLLSQATGVLWIPGCSVDLLIEVWPSLTAVKWVHCFSGIDKTFVYR
jgi:hypothetical protein